MSNVEIEVDAMERSVIESSKAIVSDLQIQLESIRARLAACIGRSEEAVLNPVIGSLATACDVSLNAAGLMVTTLRDHLAFEADLLN